jgi:hypothetical protein
VVAAPLDALGWIAPHGHVRQAPVPQIVKDRSRAHLIVRVQVRSPAPRGHEVFSEQRRALALVRDAKQAAVLALRCVHKHAQERDLGRPGKQDGRTPPEKVVQTLADKFLGAAEW